MPLSKSAQCPKARERPAQEARTKLRSDVDPRATAVVVTSFILGATTQLGVDAAAFDVHHVAGELDRWLAAAAPSAAPDRRARRRA